MKRRYGYRRADYFYRDQRSADDPTLTDFAPGEERAWNKLKAARYRTRRGWRIGRYEAAI